MESIINTISPPMNTIVQNIALREGGGPYRNTLIPKGIKAIQRPSRMKVDSNLVPLRVPSGRKNMDPNAIERIRPIVPDRYAPMAKRTQPAIIQPFK